MDALYLQWIGCAFGVLEALLLTINNRLSGWGFVSFRWMLAKTGFRARKQEG